SARRQGVAARPDDVRDALRQLLALAGSADTSPQHLVAADHLAAAYAAAWRDSFLLRQVSRFRAWSPDGRRAKVAADSLRLAGNKALGQSGVVAALRLWRESVRRAAGIGDTAGVAAGAGDRGKGFYERGERAGGGACGAPRAANRHAGRRGPAALNLVNLANLAALSGEPEAAAGRYREALALYRAEDDRPGAAEVWHDIGLLRSNRGDYAGAVAALTASLAIYEVTGPAHEVAAVRRDLADVRAATGDLQGARRELERAETALRRVGDPDAELLARLALTRGDLAVLLNGSAEADRAYVEAQGLYHRANDGAGEAEAVQGRGYLFLLREEYTRARDVLEQALREQASADPRTRAVTRLLEGYALRESGDT